MVHSSSISAASGRRNLEPLDDPLMKDDPPGDDIFRCLVLSPQVYPNSPGVHIVSSPHTLSVTSGMEHPDNVKVHRGIGELHDKINLLLLGNGLKI